ncbi:MAG: bifunctional (p)ppGpp synthetase/guanosine-3',5'-bis(diphosphate) 3'-pyrophosphohydrolase [Flavobacteriaceae bacterium]|nr:bifunctional (p)ppGpp synthetase/guanosine-3',5'-bis(diphosphate) 3'-pyrophosphohydrolase [Flavobacteriaceae bacterium]MBT3793978.1 bifunctional (p)ppGpp synthetase/guanosine-3',5'-bis(diphosphate) 3'-pyrophosphohydrolase [Flavobacteriaceae bacterium]MBT4416316.1 bifunctional (p)ppGpp synthetase/guanosine-3',5'-bis(diphosphate) 3'-pyrophosphohydrolase [Flavobacteriaceae bacterium]MBT5396005.1 bifunctional (p)ppGpp synthetase/guanosine-3',5'-bis(diphosphate) 3'-pyrophosphohydrolase [Flavobacte
MLTDSVIENNLIAKEYKELLRISYQSLSSDDRKLIRLAFNTSVDAHKNQRRKSGEPYVFHPIAVAKIVASKIGLDATCIASALLHDVIEDTDYDEKKIEKLFGKTICKIVIGLTKISKLKKEKNISLQAENFRKMLLTLNDDVRVILIKIADRLHNMQTLDVMPPEKQIKIASETLYIYAPIAHRIGLYDVKSELEDLGLKYTEPDMFNDIKNKIEQTKDEQDKYIKNFSRRINEKLKKEDLSFKISGRPKSIYSIRDKIIKKNISFEEIYDKFAIRIVYKSEKENEKFIAWKIYSIITDYYTPNPLRLRDWITSPRSNGYEALHITVVGPGSKWVEVQIRSERMHEVAEKGYATHFMYKQGKQTESGLEDWLNRLQEVLENSDTSALDFVEDFKLNLYATEIFVFTPQGDLKSLPKGSSALDFAFSIHTGLGLKTRGIKVNGKIVPLSHELKSGDQIEIIKSENTKPSANWLDYVITSRAKSKIRSALKEEKKLLAEDGKEILRRKLKQLKIKFDEKSINELGNYFNLKTSLDLFYRVGIGKIDNISLKKFATSNNNRIISFFRKRLTSNKEISHLENEIKTNFDQIVFGNEEEKMDFTLAKCCNPIPGDSVFGFVTINEGIKIHKKDCPNSISLQSKFAYRILKSKWIDSSQEEFISIINISGIDIIGIVNEITKLISSSLNINMKKMHFDTEGNTFKGKITLKVKTKNILDKLILRLKKINGIEKVARE